MFELELIPIVAEECGFSIISRSDTRIDVKVGALHILSFENLVQENDTIIFFENGWHSHGDILGEMLECEIEDVPEGVLTALKRGQALLVKNSYPNGSSNLSLEFAKWLSADEIKGLEEGESVEYSRAG